MTQGRSVVINGDLVSGKTTVSMLLAQRLRLRRVSVGDLYRDLASQRGVTALGLNLHAELDDKMTTMSTSSSAISRPPVSNWS